MEITAKPERLTGELSLGQRKPWYDLRSLIIAGLYFLLYLALDLGMKALGPPSAVGQWHLSAGLSFGLILMYGLRFAPVVLVVGLVDSLWLFPPAGAVSLAAAYCLARTLILTAAAGILRRLVSGSFVSLQYGRDVVRFLLTAGLTSTVLGAAAAVRTLLANSAPWRVLVGEFSINLIGFATGILAVTPFLLIHARPWLEMLLLGMNGEKEVPIRYLRTLRMDRPATLFALSFLAMAAMVLWLIIGQGVSETLYVFLLLCLPLVWVAVKRGLEGLSIAVPVLTFILLAACWHFVKGIDAAGSQQTILLAASLNAYMIGTGVTQIRVTGRQMERRDAILDAVSYAAQQFLGKGGWEGGLQEVMRRLGEATSVTRVFITERRPERNSQSADSWLYEWTTPDLATDEDDHRVLNLLRAQLVEENAGLLGQGQPALFLVSDIDRKKREMLQALGVRSVVIVPMFVDRQWWGCLGLEQCFIDRDWPASEVDGLKMAGQILGTLIASVRVEQQFRQLTGNIQAVFWISSPDGHFKQYVSPGYEEIWGRACTSLQKQPSSWMEAIHKEDQARVGEALVKQAWGEFDEEYRIVRPDRSVRWVRDRAFPVRDQAGQVYRIVGIAEDITKQKKTEEQLRAATVMLSSFIDHLQTGIVVEDEDRRITHVNQAFSSMFILPIPAKSLFGVDSRLIFHQSLQFAKRIEEIIQAGGPVLGEELQWEDRVFLRNYIPLSVGEDFHYHLWQYQDVTVSRRAEEQIKSSLKEKEVLLKEIHHRVKNNLQIISSLLSLQAKEGKCDPKTGQTFKESQDRVKAMALIHERLYQSRDFAKIDFGGYVRNLTGHLLRSYKVNSEAIRLNLEVDPVPMNFDVAIPCGLIINELVSNALKYAFPDGRGGEIRVRFAGENGHGLTLTVSDDGVGFAGVTNPEESESLGLKLVRSLTEQLGGTVCYRNQDGFQCDINIPRNKP